MGPRATEVIASSCKVRTRATTPLPNDASTTTSRRQTLAYRSPFVYVSRRVTQAIVLPGVPALEGLSTTSLVLGRPALGPRRRRPLTTTSSKVAATTGPLLLSVVDLATAGPAMEAYASIGPTVRPGPIAYRGLGLAQAASSKTSRLPFYGPTTS